VARAAGEGRAAEASREGPPGPGGVVTPATSSHAAPWTLADWPALRSAAAAEAERVPDAYRPLLRAYFEP
jgi:hypothetical protein